MYFKDRIDSTEKHYTVENWNDLLTYRNDLLTLYINPLPDDNSLCLSKLKAMLKMIIFVLYREKTLCYKGENNGYQHFLFLPRSFQKLSVPGLLKMFLRVKKID